MKKDKGITLVALVITIIILIILAGISINTVMGDNGIIKKTKQAKQNIQLAQEAEQKMLNQLYADLEEQTGLGGEEELIDELLLFKKKIAQAITDKGVETSETASADTMAENIRKIGECNEPVAKDILKAGDYIKYDTGDTSVGENGVITCRVLYDASSEYGLQIISDGSIKDVTLGGSDWNTGRDSYNNAIATLNSEAENYINTKYAVDARCVGSNPTVDTNGKMTNKNAESTDTIVLPPSKWSSYTRPSGWTSDDTGCKNIDNNYETDYNTIKKLETDNRHTFYWLASRDGGANSSFCDFGVRYVNENGDFSYRSLCDVISSGHTDGGFKTNGLRPCFSLRLDIKIIEGDGKSEGTAYILG